MLLFKYSMMGSLSRRTVHPAAERSAEASLSSKACSILRLGNPSISRIRPEKTLTLFSLATVRDRKSTRLNSSHVAISYAVFCLKKKKDRRTIHQDAQRS